MNLQHESGGTSKPSEAEGTTAAVLRSRQHNDARCDTPRPLRRRLPAVPVPLPGESLFSWVDHLAYSYEVDRTQIMNRLGLDPKTAHAFRLARHTAELTISSAMSLHAATGLSPESMHDMTLFGFVKQSEGRLRRHLEYDWAPEETWSFCPPCLQSPARWPLRWYQSWAVMCPDHDCYMASYCPDCGSPFSPSILRSDAPGRCPGFLDRDHEPSRLPKNAKRRSKRKRCGRPMWEMDTTSVSDPVVRRTHLRLTRLIASGSPTDEDEQWYADLRTLRTLLNDPNALRVRAFTTPDPALQERFTTGEEDTSTQEREETAPVVIWRPSASGFLSPMRRTVSDPQFGTIWEGQRDPVSEAAKLSVIGSVLESRDVAAAAEEVFSVVHMAHLRDFGERLPSYLSRSSPQLRELIERALASDALAQLHGAQPGGHVRG
ncbi:TniQ family protein [Streptomyces microflavus]|uniref:TniQ family protein n=1 Tax=Streptomyces microflavus TaxID=1919 RepID=UPI00365876D0